jgi:hypothetical protein
MRGRFTEVLGVVGGEGVDGDGERLRRSSPARYWNYMAISQQEEEKRTSTVSA